MGAQRLYSPAGHTLPRAQGHVPSEFHGGNSAQCPPLTITDMNPQHAQVTTYEGGSPLPAPHALTWKVSAHCQIWARWRAGCCVDKVQVKLYLKDTGKTAHLQTIKTLLCIQTLHK